MVNTFIHKGSFIPRFLHVLTQTLGAVLKEQVNDEKSHNACADPNFKLHFYKA